MTAPLTCDGCRAQIPLELPSLETFAACPGCGAALLGEVYPAFHRELPAGEPGEDLGAPGEAACFHHPGKRAARTCDRCGVFVCRLCDLAVAGERICPRCLDQGVKKKKIGRLETERVLYGRIALSLAVLPLLIFYLTFLTAPAALFVALRYWKAPRSLVKPARSAHVVAIVVAALELAGWAFGVVWLFTVILRSRGA